MITDCHNCGRPGHWNPGDNRVTHPYRNPCPLPPPDRCHLTQPQRLALQGVIEYEAALRDDRLRRAGRVAA